METIILPQELKRKLDAKDESIVLLDIRTQEERSEAKIEPSMFIPMMELLKRLDELPKDKLLVIYCASGGRSAFAVNILRSKGFNVQNLAGGILAWQNLNYPVQ